MKPSAPRLLSWIGTRVDGQVQPPGAGVRLRVVQMDGSELALAGHGDAFDLYYARVRTAYVFALEPRTALRLAWAILWRYWVRGTWCGLRARLWRWAFVRGAGPAP